MNERGRKERVMSGRKEELILKDDRERERRMCGSIHFVTEQSRKLWNAPAPVAVETEGKLFHVSCFVAHGNCPEIERWIERKREREISGFETRNRETGIKQQSPIINNHLAEFWQSVKLSTSRCSATPPQFVLCRHTLMCLELGFLCHTKGGRGRFVREPRGAYVLFT